jgi:YVTN family beta-propeller protein
MFLRVTFVRVIPILIGLLAMPLGVFGNSGLPLTVIANVALPGAPSRFDYESLDPSAGRLFVAHLAASQLVVYDIETDRVVTTISGISKIHGVLVVPARGRVYATATGSNAVAVIDERTMKIIASVPVGVHPDGMAFDPDNRMLFVSNEHGDSDTVIDTTSNRRIATIPLGGEVGNTQYDARDHRIYVNVQTTGELVAIDPMKDRVIARYPVHGCESNHGLQLDDAHGKAYIACEKNAKLIVFDLRSFKVVQSLAIGDDPDVLAYDIAHAVLYVAAESGTVTMLAANAEGVRKLGQAFLAKNAHIVAVDQRTHLVYFPVLGVRGPRMLVMRPRA